MLNPKSSLDFQSRSAVGIMLSVFLLMFMALGCSSNSAASPREAGSSAQSAKRDNPAPFAFTEADLEAYAKGLAKETSLVHTAHERGLNAKTPEKRAQAAQDEWEAQTIPGGAQASGLPEERYRNVRSTVNRVLETLDFQGKIDGPLEIDIEHAAPETRQRLNHDPFAELAPASAAALRARLSQLVPVWVAYMQLTAVNG